ncbi:dihydrolipoyl dehydrogenase family protein [Rhodopirellula sp. MGV]|uniref:dihydrolipoyl dehydrogenase family protein n=1 Tax=Rhodopirellula sp. MGV TaxID=2023130 RepID=UPI000B96AF5F|nr:NAD(P)/FAD-dependent oxidoreductase [Rhodopirellula sp. MGV]OYP34898.1 hypothetical protein CGZ80_12750 [Rhodopirellula sp. MGV]PNY38205.1 NAD(P)/FAD-dependent oxidoreductase [Rhodopirellula baltica]
MLKPAIQTASAESGKSYRVDLVVLGSGPAAKSVAVDAAESGHQVALVESRDFGGTCALRGCNPKKVLTNAAMLSDRVHLTADKLFANASAELDWQKLHAFQQEFTEPVANNTEENLNDKGIQTFQGQSRFISPRQLRIHSGRDNATLDSPRFLIATGARPRTLSFPGSEFVMTSGQFLAQERLPKRILFLGGGYISMEFGHVACSLGSEVTVLEKGEQLMKGFDPDLVEQLKDWSSRKGMRLVMGRQIESIEQSADGSLVVTSDDQQRFHVDSVVHGAGRVPNLDDLNLEAANIDYTESGIRVDEYLRSTSHPGVFAAGDCADNGGLMLTPIANEDAYVVGKNLFVDQPTKRPDYRGVASVAFTCPPIARVGMLESEAKEAGYDVDVKTRDTSTWGSVRKTGMPCAAYKVVLEKSSARILGAHLLGVGAEEQVNLFAFAIKHGIDAKAIKASPLAYPTMTADIKRMV